MKIFCYILATILIVPTLLRLLLKHSFGLDDCGYILVGVACLGTAISGRFDKPKNRRKGKGTGGDEC
jgi:hypothetical protein